MEIKDLLDNINIIYKRKQYINNIVKPILNVYTTGLSDKYVRGRWNKYIDDWLHKVLSEYYIINLQHYDNFAGTINIKSGTINSNYLDLASIKEPYFIFDFSHAVIDDYTKNKNAVYIPYNNGKIDPFFEFGLKPFIVDKFGNITTYMTQLLSEDYEFVEKEFTIDKKYLKNGQTNKVTYKTLKFQNIVFTYDNKWIKIESISYNKYTYLLKLLNHGNFQKGYIQLKEINNILKQINMSKFRSSIRSKTITTADDEYKFN
jgi:hypothetical protein